LAQVDPSLLHVGNDDLSIDGRANKPRALTGVVVSTVTTSATTVDLDDDLFSMGGVGSNDHASQLAVGSLNFADYINQNKRDTGPSLFD
jgi:hypothetical protein